jgi:putative aminopeptidase FrvX
MYIDIGAQSKREAERYVSIGDTFVCAPSLTKLCGSRVCGRPIDDRVGCLALLELAERFSGVDTDASIYYVFSVQEEVGCRGSKPATFAIAPDIALCFDVTSTGDTPNATPMACSVGKGVAVKVKDNSVICHSGLVSELCDIAKSEKIPYQREVLTFGGTDTSSMQLTGLGSVAGALSIPTRYVHSGVELCDMKDVKACIDLAEKYILSIANDKNRKPYSETNTCATLASDVVNKFMNPKNKNGNLFTGILEYFKNNENYNAISDIMTFIPFTSHNYNAKIRNLGDSTLYFNNDENR